MSRIRVLFMIILLMSLSFAPLIEKESSAKNDLASEEKELNIKEFLNKPLAKPIVSSFLLAPMCRIKAIFIGGGNFRVGFPIFGLFKLLSWKGFSADIINACWGVFGIVETDGMVRQHILFAVPCFMSIIGFVGTHIRIPMVLDYYDGYAALTFALGLGLHSISLSPPTMILLGLLGGIILGIVLATLFTGEQT